MPALPTGEVTLLFTDIEGSTRLLERLGDDYADALAEHRRIVRQHLERNGGVEVDTQGDAFFVAFADAAGAVGAAVDAQRGLARTAVRVRMGLHRGRPSLTEEGYVGMDVHRAARIAAAAHGGQIVISRDVQQALAGGVELRDLGEHRLKDLAQPEWLYQPLVPGLPSEFPPLKSLSATNLPVPSRRLIGRAGEVAAVAAALEAHRLVTITGSGGTGKSRLAVEVASQLVDGYPNGVFFVGLAAVPSAELVGPAIAGALGVREEAGDPLADTLAEHLAHRRTLLVLDNFEHVVDASPLVASLLERAPEISVLATSREALRLTAEREYPLLPLPVDAAAELFVERSGTADHDPAVAELCRRLDGLPLAVELAAARAKLLSPSDMLERMDRALPLLTEGQRDLPARQRTLRATIDWSYQLLTDAEQQLLRALSVFPAGASLEAVEAVAETDAELLGSLIDKSLVRTRDMPARRYWMLQTIREYAGERLREAGEASAVRGRLAAWVEQEAARAVPHLLSGEQVTWARRLDQEFDTIREVIEWSLDHDDPALAVRVASVLIDYWDPSGRNTEARGWLERGIDRWRPPDDAWAARALIAFSATNLQAGDLQRARDAAEQAVALADASGDPSLRSRARTQLAGTAMLADDFEETAVQADEAHRLAEQIGDHALAAFALNCRAVAAFEHGDPDGAQRLFGEAVVHLRTVGDQRNTAVLISNLGIAAVLNGDFAAAEDAFRSAVELFQETGERGRLPGIQTDLADALVLGGAVDAAAEQLATALPNAVQLGDTPVVLAALNAAAAVAAAQGDDRTAAVIRGSVEAEAEAREVPMTGPDGVIEARLLQPAAERLGEAAWSAARAQGRALPLERAVDRALAVVVQAPRVTG